MKLNFSYPVSGAQKLIDIEDELKVRFFYDKRMGTEIELDPLGPEYKGYICRISGGNDKQGFPMKQGVLTNGRVRLLMSKGHSCYRPRRTGERKRKSVHGCIVDASLSVLNLVVLKKGEQDIPGLTDRTVPRRLGPKRASGIKKLFNLTKQDDVRQFVVRRPLAEKEGKPARTKAPKIQRLITPRRLQRKRFRVALKKKRAEKSKTEAAEYAKLLAQMAKEEKERKEEAKRRRSSASRGSGSNTPSVSENVAPKKKTGKVPAQAPEVVQQLAKRGAEQVSSKQDVKPAKKGPAATKLAASKAEAAAPSKGAGTGAKKAPQAAVKDSQSKKVVDTKEVAASTKSAPKKK